MTQSSESDAALNASGKTEQDSPSTEPSASSSSPSNLLGRALRGGSYLFLQKIFTFAINSFILRRLHLSVTGAVTVRFELALATVFLVRDSFRLAYLRMPPLVDAGQTTTSSSAKRNSRQQQLVNMSWISTLISWLLAATIIAVSITSAGNVTTAITSHGEAPQIKQQTGLEGYTQVLVMYCVAAMIEATAEPMYLLAHSSVLVGWQVAAQGMAFLVRAFVQYMGIFVIKLDGLLCYGLAELAYATTLLLVFAWFFYWKLCENKKTNTLAMQSMAELLPGRVQDKHGGFVDAESLSIMGPLGIQSVVKYLLTEGDKWVLSLFATLQQMGVYGIVFHLGSLVPRIVFFPLEEATKTVISKMDASNAKEVAQAKRFIIMLLKLMHVIGMVFVCFGVNYAYTLVFLLYGVEKAHGGVGSALSMYCLYIPFLGLNGICEAFVHAVGNKTQLTRLNQLMGVFFLIYASSAMFFMGVFQLGTTGIILANCVNMSCRILYCMSFLAKYFTAATATKPAKESSLPSSPSALVLLLTFWREALPDRIVMAAFAASLVISSISRRVLLVSDAWVRHGAHVAVGGACFAVVLLALYIRERKLIREELRYLKRGGGGGGPDPMTATANTKDSVSATKEHAE